MTDFSHSLRFISVSFKFVVLVLSIGKLLGARKMPGARKKTAGGSSSVAIVSFARGIDTKEEYFTSRGGQWKHLEVHKRRPRP
jgi:hypothetical protein